MASDNASITSVTLTKRSFSRKHRLHSHSQSREKSGTDEFRPNRTMTAINRPSSKLPNVSTNANTYPSTLGKLFIGFSYCSALPNLIEPTLFKHYHAQQKDSLVPSSSKLERQSTNIIDSEVRLPVLYSLANDDDRKRMSEFRRRQVRYSRDSAPMSIRSFL